MHFVELKLCEKVGNVLEECNGICQCSMQLILTWMESEIFERVIDGDVALCSQAKSYIARSFMTENKNRLEAISSAIVFRNEILYWIGYVITYWCFEYEERPRDILRQYDMESVVQSYEVLHSLSVKTAIEKIKEDYFRG